MALISGIGGGVVAAGAGVLLATLKPRAAPTTVTPIVTPTGVGVHGSF